MTRKPDSTDSNAVTTSLFVALVLILWTGCAVLLARAAERRTLGMVGAASFRTIAAALCVAAGALALQARPGEAAARGITCIALVVVADADARTGLIFDAVTLPAAIIVSAIGIVLGSALACAAGVGVLVGTFGTIVVVSRGRAMGLGDVKAMFSIGAAFGPLGAIVAIFAACLSGTVAAFLTGRLQRGQCVRFGPHLAAGAAFALVLTDPILRLVMGQ
jgi:prepilin signal peptidase PulO-like enzyme (type II secretory pathway)